MFWFAFPNDNDVGNISICLLASIIFNKISVQSLCPFLNQTFWFLLDSLFSYYWILSVLFIFWIEILYQIGILHIFSLSLWLSFNHFKCVFEREKVFNLYKIQIMYLFLCGLLHHADFSPRFLLKVVYCYVLHGGLWSISI